MSETELKLCNCGKEATGTGDGEIYRVRCTECSTRTRWCSSAQEAAEAWNARPVDDELRADLAEAVGMLKSLEVIFPRGYTGDPCCPECGYYCGKGHKGDCKLNAIIEKHKGKGK